MLSSQQLLSSQQKRGQKETQFSVAVSSFSCTIPDLRCLLLIFWVNESIFTVLMEKPTGTRTTENYPFHLSFLLDDIQTWTNT